MHGVGVLLQEFVGRLWWCAGLWPCVHVCACPACCWHVHGGWEGGKGVGWFALGPGYVMIDLIPLPEPPLMAVGGISYIPRFLSHQEFIIIPKYSMGI